MSVTGMIELLVFGGVPSVDGHVHVDHPAFAVDRDGRLCSGHVERRLVHPPGEGNNRIGNEDNARGIEESE